MPPSKTLADIPTLTNLYLNSALKPSLKPSLNPITAPSLSVNNRISLFRGDITTLGLDAILNAANTSLLGGGGIDGAIHRAAGPGLLRECRNLGGCATGSAKMTSGYNLPAKYVIHAVGPRYYDQPPEQSEKLLRGCYQKTLSLAAAKGDVRTLALCAISTGIYGYPMEAATRVACETVRTFLEKNQGLDRVVFVMFETKDVVAYSDMIP